MVASILATPKPWRRRVVAGVRLGLIVVCSRIYVYIRIEAVQ